MMRGLRRFDRLFNRFRNGERGSATVEMVLWMPIVVLILVLITDASFIFNRRSEMLRTVQDGNRAFSVGRLTSVQETQTFVRNRILAYAPSALVTTTLQNGVITTTASVEIDDLLTFGLIPELSPGRMAVQSQHFLEY
jgi:Flp pilus assembly protein TadG